MTHQHKSQGKTFYLHKVLKKRRGHKNVCDYFFAKDVCDGQYSKPMGQLPKGYNVVIAKSGLPVLIKL